MGTQSVLGNGFFLNSIIQQAYQTPGGVGSFAAFNIGVCNATGTKPGDAAAMQPYVNNVPLISISSAGCSPFATLSGPQAVATGVVTTLTAAVDMQFNPIAGGGAAITLPWGDDLPDLSATTLNNDINSGASLSTVLNDIQTLDPAITQQVAEPAMLMLFGVGLVEPGAVQRRLRV